MKKHRMTIKEALNALQEEAELMETHDPGIAGARIVREAVTVLRRSLPWSLCWPVLALWTIILVFIFAGCTTRKTEAPMPTTGPAPRALSVAPTPKPFDCKAYALSRLPWSGDTSDPAFRAINDALLPDEPRFADRRRVACNVLEVRAR